MADDDPGHTTISVSHATKQQLELLKADGETWDLFLRTMSLDKAKNDLKNWSDETMVPTAGEVEIAEELAKAGEIDQDTLEGLKARREKYKNLEKDVFGP